MTGDENNPERTTLMGSSAHGRHHPAFSSGAGEPGAHSSRWRPFFFRDLPRVSRAHTRLINKVRALFGRGGDPGAGADAVMRRLGSLFELPVQLRVECVEVVRLADIRRRGSAPAFLASISWMPHQARGCLEVELSLAHSAVEVLLGGTPEIIPLRPLTDIEEGVVAFVLLEVMGALEEKSEPAERRLRLEGVLPQVDRPLLHLDGEEEAVVVQLRCSIGTEAGWVRLVFPASLVDFAEVSAEAAGSRRLSPLRRPGAQLAIMRTWLRAEIGRVGIGAADLMDLAPGDVVLTNPLSVRCDRRENGRAELRVGTGVSGWMDADVWLDGNTYKATIRSFRFDAPDPDDDEDDTNRANGTAPGGVNMQEPTREGTQLLSDVPLQIAIELARVSTSADQVVGLHVGQIVELNRGPGEPVALSLNGKVIARGELVEVEGQLGVRILSVS